MNKILIMLLFAPLLFLAGCSDEIQETTASIEKTNVSEIELFELHIKNNEYDQRWYRVYTFYDNDTKCYIFVDSQKGGISCVK